MRCEKVYPKNWLPQRIGYPKQIGYPKKNDKKHGYPPKNVTPKKLITKRIGYPKNFGVLYCEGVYDCILEKWRTLLRTGLLMRFKHYIALVACFTGIVLCGSDEPKEDEHGFDIH